MTTSSLHTSWQSTLGAWPESQGIHFRLWAPDATQVELVIEGGPTFSLTKKADGYFEYVAKDLRVGTLYRYRIDGRGPFPDPASRFQPQGVHGPSQVVDAKSFVWQDANWPGLTQIPSTIYELHVGTFTPEGTFQGVKDRLAYLKELGIDAIELMPVNDFPGRWNWGYDGVALFAPARCYGSPDDLRSLVNEAHRLGLSVMLDVVYNHFGPDGNFLREFSQHYFTKRHHTPWGDAVNLDDTGSPAVRDFFIENALYWIHDFHIDGLRLDATHALQDDGPKHFLKEFVERVHGQAGKQIPLVAEDHRNLAELLEAPSKSGYGFHGVWADDFHHAVRRFLAGDHESYYADYRGTVDEMAHCINQGWLFTGQHSQHENGPRGTDPQGLSPDHFVTFIQNHDQVGNRAMGERLHHQVDLPSYLTASALLLTMPQTVMLFMGQEWAASAPFQFFTDHKADLGKLITEGRRNEFKHFSIFADPKATASIPDPQSPVTFERSKLSWDERRNDDAQATLALYRRLLSLRRDYPAFRDEWSWEALTVNPQTLLVKRRAPKSSERPELLWCVFRLSGSGDVNLPTETGIQWQTLFSTEEFLPHASPIKVESTAAAIALRFERPGAIALKGLWS